MNECSCCLLLAGYLLGLFFEPEDGSRKVLPKLVKERTHIFFNGTLVKSSKFMSRYNHFNPHLICPSHFKNDFSQSKRNDWNENLT
jgi:hypothetical protein